jgi:hypothetical protein
MASCSGGQAVAGVDMVLMNAVRMDAVLIDTVSRPFPSVRLGGMPSAYIED